MIALNARSSRKSADFQLLDNPRLPIVPPMDITGRTRVFMILGDPIAQVQAPALFNPIFRAQGIDAVLVPAHVSPADLGGFVQQVLRARNIDGLWLTIPHKAAVLPLLDRCDRLGRIAQAVNAVRRNADGTLEGALFDGEGFAKALDRFEVPVPGRRVLIVGTGGAGMAIAVSLAERGAAAIALFDPDTARSAAAAARINAAFAGQPARVATTADAAGFDLVVQASPLGMERGDALPIDPASVEPGAVVVDILMKNQPTPLLRACAARGLQVHPGFEKLNQQIPDYLRFFGLPVPGAVADRPADAGVGISMPVPPPIGR
jgi:shikimate dehydrogenase